MTEHSRTYSWTDPAPLAEAARELDGLTLLTKVMAGELPAPSIAATMGFRLVEVADGRAVFDGEWQEFLVNPAGTLHGGWYGTILDSAMGCAVHTTLPAGTSYTTLEYKVQITRGAGRGSGVLRAEGQVIHRGRRTATAEAKLLDAAGKVYAHATTTCIIL
ncbi:MAG: PaaI family thioesterase [Alphaproteobacteria bacterium]|nr:PaaI family thioesterase [Alphaproteobacteria bacterium]